MTRQEAKKLFREDVDAYGKPKKIMGKIDQIFDEFEKEPGAVSLLNRIMEEHGIGDPILEKEILEYLK